MPNALDRRRFLRQGLVLTGGALALPVLSLGAEPMAGEDVALARVLTLARSFAQQVSVRPAAPGQDAAVTRLDADIADWGRFAAALGSAKRVGISSVRTEGSRVTLRIGERVFEIETRDRLDAEGAPRPRPGRRNGQASNRPA